jgi:sarcosine oxidase gamma subunit
MTDAYREACMAMLRACLHNASPEVIRAAAVAMRRTGPDEWTMAAQHPVDRPEVTR